jgi:hypothetical protein
MLVASGPPGKNLPVAQVVSMLMAALAMTPSHPVH